MVRASASEYVDWGLILSWVKPMTLKLVFTASLLDVHCSALKEQCGEQAGKFTCCAVGKGTKRDSPNLEWETGGRQLLSELVKAFDCFLVVGV